MCATDSLTVIRGIPRRFFPGEQALRGKECAWRRDSCPIALVDPRVRFQPRPAREDLKSAERDEPVKKDGYSAYDYHE